MRGRRVTALALAAWISAALGWPAAALAAGSVNQLTQSGGPGSPLTPFNNPGPTTTSTTPTVAAPTTSTSGGGLNGTDAVVIGIGALLVLGGISFFIWRDARKRAPVRQRAAADGGSGPRQRPQKTRKLSPAERRRRKRGRAR